MELTLAVVLQPMLSMVVDVTLPRRPSPTTTGKTLVRIPNAMFPEGWRTFTRLEPDLDKPAGMMI
jgi:hypothetical protein